jgi:hypothetical protein
MKSPTLRVLLSFGGSKTPDNTLITFARNVLKLIYAAAGFTAIPVTEADLLASIEGFADSKAAQPNGGKTATALKNQKRVHLVDLLKEIAAYVQVTSKNDLAMLLSSGFSAASTSRTRFPLSKPTILRVGNGMSGESLLTLSTEKNVRGCEIRVAEIGPEGVAGEFRAVVFSTSSRNISITGLTPGAQYSYQGRTLGGTTTYSDWSDPIVQRVL